MLLVVQGVHVVLAVALITLILMQSKGVGLSGAFGGGGEVFHTRRGVEKVIFYMTIFVSFAFVVTSFLNVWFS